jgi:hypothetical protein
MVVVDDLDALAFQYYIDYANAQDDLLLLPALKDLGDEFPEIETAEISEGSGNLQGRGFKVKFTPRVMFYKAGESKIVRTKKKIARHLGMMIERAAWLAFTTNDTVDSDGAEFDTFLGHVGMEGGYSDETGGGQVLMVCSAGYEWDQGGNILQQLRRVATLMGGQNRALGDSTQYAYDKEMNPSTSIMIMDSLTYGVLYDHLMATPYEIVQVGINAIRVPKLFSLTFASANYAVTAGSLSVCDTATRYGHAIIFDMADVPIQGYQSLPPLPEYTRSGDIDAGNVDVLIRSDDDPNGNTVIRYQFMYVFVLEDPKGVIFWSSLRSSAA